VKTCRYLGVLTSNDLSPSGHIDYDSVVAKDINAPTLYWGVL